MQVPQIPAPESLPERPGEPDCPVRFECILQERALLLSPFFNYINLPFFVYNVQYFLKTQKCKYGLNCKFNHPKEKLDSSTGVVQVGFIIYLTYYALLYPPLCYTLFISI